MGGAENGCVGGAIDMVEPTTKAMDDGLRIEREASTLKISELTTFLDGGDKDLSKRRKKFCKFFKL